MSCRDWARSARVRRRRWRPSWIALTSEIAAQSVADLAGAGDLARRLGEGLGVHVDRFGAAIDRLPPALAAMERGAARSAGWATSWRNLPAPAKPRGSRRRHSARIEAALASSAAHDEQLEAIRRGVDRTGAAIEALSGQWAAAFEKSSRTTQDQLARTLGSLKDALDLLNVSMEQGNALYRSIVKKMFDKEKGPDIKAA